MLCVPVAITFFLSKYYYSVHQHIRVRRVYLCITSNSNKALGLLAQTPLKSNDLFSLMVFSVSIWIWSFHHPVFFCNKPIARIFQSVNVAFELKGFHCTDSQLCILNSWVFCDYSSMYMHNLYCIILNAFYGSPSIIIITIISFFFLFLFLCIYKVCIQFLMSQVLISFPLICLVIYIIFFSHFCVVVAAFSFLLSCYMYLDAHSSFPVPSIITDLVSYKTAFLSSIKLVIKNIA